MSATEIFGSKRQKIETPREIKAAANNGNHPRNLDDQLSALEQVVENAAMTEQARQNWKTNSPSNLTLLEEISAAFSILPYGDMIEFTEATGADPAKVWAWATKAKITSA